MPAFETVLSTSVPPNERPFATEHLPGASHQEAALSKQVVAEHVDARALAVAYYDPVTPELLADLQALEVLVTRSDGYDHLPLAWLEAHGLPAYHLEGYATPAVAEYAVGAIIGLLRRVPEARATVSAPVPAWQRGHLMGRGLPDVTVGVLGVGRIGSTVVRRLAPFGPRLVGYDIEPRRELEDEVPGFTFVETYQELLEASDVLTVHVPLTEETEGMVDGRAIERLPDGACLVNSARGPIVDQDAVVEALKARKLAGYAADVLPGEPDPPDLQRLQALETVWLTPHLAAYDQRTVRARYERTARILEAVLEGEPGRVEAYRLV